MKRLLAWLLCAALLLVLAPARAEEDTVTEYVVNCEEWVSLREKADIKSKRLTTVPLGAEVTDCEAVDGTGFISCVYQGQKGYIRSIYLDLIPDAHTPEQLLSLGDPVIDEPVGIGKTQRLLAVRYYSPDRERLRATVFDAQGRQLSSLWMDAGGGSQASQLHAVLGGADRSRLYLLDGEENLLSAYEVGENLSRRKLWSIPFIGSGFATAVDDNGTLYVTGYFGTAPTCVSPDGEILWQGSAPEEDIYWPYRIGIRPDRIDVTYEHGPEEGAPAIVSFSRTDGHILDTRKALPVSLEWEEYSGAEPDEYFVISMEEPVAKVLLSLDAAVSDLRLLELELSADGDEPIWTAQELKRWDGPAGFSHLLIYMTFYGDIPSNGFAYTDEAGAEHAYTIEISGEDGDLIAQEISLR